MTRRRHSSKAFGRSVHVVGRVVRLVEPRVEELGGSSVSVGHLNCPPRPPGMAQKSVASFLESMTGLSVSFDGLGQPVVFRADNVDVEFDVVAHDVGRLGEVLVKFGQHLSADARPSRRAPL